MSAILERSGLLERPPFGAREDELLRAELVALSIHHLAGCPQYAAMWPNWSGADSLAELPFVHATVFKHRRLRTEAEGIAHQREVTSSSTSGQAPSAIPLDTRSSERQAASTRAVLEDFLGVTPRPLVVLDSARALRSPALGARTAAALALRPLSSDLRFVLDAPDDPGSLDWDAVLEVLGDGEALLVYGFTWMLWLGWALADVPERLRNVRVDFVHSGGWKKLEAISVARDTFDSALLATVGGGSGVLDYYGMVEQIGMIFPLCPHGVRHVPVWGDVLVRDPWTLASLPAGEVGMLQLLNILALGAPYHSVLSEDLGRLVEGTCACGRPGRTFVLEGRVPKAELRGCSNV
jgi:Acyl-protein synthetase, LuxE